jgi:hypothetical protein
MQLLQFFFEISDTSRIMSRVLDYLILLPVLNQALKVGSILF